MPRALAISTHRRWWVVICGVNKCPRDADIKYTFIRARNFVHIHSFHYEKYMLLSEQLADWTEKHMSISINKTQKAFFFSFYFTGFNGKVCLGLSKNG